MQCHTCGNQVEEGAVSCPSCGAPQGAGSASGQGGAPQYQQYYSQPNIAAQIPAYGYAPYQGTQVPQNLAPELLEVKSIATCIILTIVTFGFYSIYWVYTLVKKIKLLNGEAPACAGEVLLFFLVPFYSWYWMYTRSKKLCEAALRYRITISDYSVIYLILTIFELNIVAYALIQDSLNAIAREFSHVVNPPRR